MFRVIVILGVVSHCNLVASDPVREVTSLAARAEHQLVPAFYNGHIYWIGMAGDDSQTTIYAPDGHLAFSFDTQNGAVENIAVDTDGSVAIAWQSQKSAGIDLRDRSGTLTRTIQTGRYVATHLAFAEDHSLWSLGWQWDRDGTQSDRHDYMTVRKYQPDGKEAGAYLARSSFPPGLEPGMTGWQKSSSIVVAHDRVGLWAYSGDSGDKTEWVELDLNGVLLDRWRLDQFHHFPRVALTIDGHLFVQNQDSKTQTHRLYKLDRASSAWREVDAPPSGWLEGAEENALVFSDVGLGPMHIRWYEHLQ